MKRFTLMLMAAAFAITASAQYDVGTSTTTTDYFGNQKTTHRNQYGEVTGTSTTTTDYFGNTTIMERRMICRSYTTNESTIYCITFVLAYCIYVLSR